jgi:hypothetical protein
MTRAPMRVALPIRRLVRRLQALESVEERLLEVVGGWHEEWRKRGALPDPEVELQVHVLQDLLAAVQEPEITDAGVERILAREPVAAGAVQVVASALRSSAWLAAAPGIVDQRLKTLENLAAGAEYEDRYNLATVVRLLQPHRDALPPEVRQDLEAAFVYAEAGVAFSRPATPPPVAGEELAELRELLEEVPER